uniref:Neprosin PEP catalytic domain-containing protein n=1 Tax=Nicotiana tabacum TaxID=4097 RepID=A0A1S3YY04_TOBAC|nr:PREDICTED: uncharacterized protein LOC107780970 [Nicotiana tabacum]
MMIQQWAIGYILVLAISLLLSCNEVQGRTKLSYLEDLELEKQLKLLNKPAVKSIKTKYGDIYDCVNFYQQPAFDHPLLQNHTFHPQMKPTLPIMKEYSDESIIDWPMGRSEGVGCPKGTVPIRRTTKNDLIRQKLMPPAEDVSFSTSFSYGNNLSNKVTFPSKGYKLAIVQTENNPSNKFGGAGMVTAIYTPRVKGQQHSACRLKIQKGPENIQVGWRVDPTLYGDGRSRLYTHFQAGKNQCFNTQCPGFVIVNRDIPLDFVYSPVTQRGSKDAWVDKMYITRDLVNGNWWLLLTRNQTQVGFWPKQIFDELNDFASTIEWGGVVYSPPGVLEPPMGSSFFPIGDTRYDAYCRNIGTIDDNGQETEAGNLIPYMTNPDLYKVVDASSEGSSFKHSVFYGGPGESTEV